MLTSRQTDLCARATILFFTQGWPPCETAESVHPITRAPVRAAPRKRWPVTLCVPTIAGDLPPPGAPSDDLVDPERFSIPALFADLGVEQPAKELKFRGGEREALARLESIRVSEQHVRAEGA